MAALGVGLFIVKGVLQASTAAGQSKQSEPTTGTTAKPPAVPRQITSFAGCKTAPGSKLTQTIPRQCTTATGQTFTDTSPPPAAATTSKPPQTAVAAPAASSPQSSPASAGGAANNPANGGSGGTQVPNAGLRCTSPAYSAVWPQTDYAGYGKVQNDVQSDGTGPSTDSERLNVCSDTNWNVVANWMDRGGSINAYPDTSFDFGTDKTVSQYSAMQTCFGEEEPVPSGPQWPTAGGSEWDYAYDVWINNHTGEDTWSNDIEIMVWNDYTDTSIYPPAGSRAVTIDGVAYHMFRGGGPNEWIYTRDSKVTSGCFDMLNIIRDMTDHGTATTIFTDTGQRVQLSASGLTTNAAPQHLEYGVEISGTYGTQTFQITNATLSAQ